MTPYPGPVTCRADAYAVMVWALQGIGSGALSASRGRAVIDCAEAWLWAEDVRTGRRKIRGDFDPVRLARLQRAYAKLTQD